ncbi:MAG: portal protein, partial [Thiobacillus sp.]
IRAAHKIVDPPLLLYGDGILSSFNARPNALNYGGVDDQGRQLVIPMKTGSNLPIALEMTDQKRKAINDAFYITLFQILVENPRMTATEAMIRAQEKGQLLAPTVGRQQSEWLGAVIDRDIDIAMVNNMIRPPPDSLIEAGGGIKVNYTSPLSRLRRAEDGVAIMRTLEQLAPLANLKPQVLDIFDDDAIGREIADINGVPAKIMRSVEIVAGIREERAKAQQAAVEMEQAEQMANTARNGAKAAEIIGGMGGGEEQEAMA